ncbi:hypothetical protein EVJ58_g5706 [Rhodofomes roseus]|uniref:BTB domain-containing protein n=1 Tax=Rhodofomes roseus TaxID=34475 RepID=A0A4Y9YC36_9APHY|nr:hypothetical protein EVJ58_g5706 [Rhodofomes roseus]
MSEIARKRPRVSLDADAEQKVLQDHPALYHDDGNVILSCGSTLFRVHRSILSKHSPVFRDILERKEDTKTEILRGCLHVALEDTKEEVEALLNVIYDGFRVDFPDLTVVNFPTLSNIFRMATKYRIDRTQTDIMKRMKQEWPYDLDRRDARTQAGLRIQQQRQAANGAANVNVNAALLEQEELAVPPATAIALLRSGGCTDKELLVPLFYALSCSAWQFGGPAVGHHIASLSHADIERFIVGLEQIRTAFASLAMTMPDSKHVTIPASHMPCYKGVSPFWQEALTIKLQAQYADAARRPIELLKDAVALARSPGYLAKHGLCPTCAALVVAYLERTRNEFWSKLPTFFGLT